jgi:hypothetical protein
MGPLTLVFSFTMDKTKLTMPGVRVRVRSHWIKCLYPFQEGQLFRQQRILSLKVLSTVLFIDTLFEMSLSVFFQGELRWLKKLSRVRPLRLQV